MLPIIMLSARSGEESRVEGITAGADDYVIKPFSARELVARVRTHLEISRLRRETDLQNRRLLTLVEVAPAAIAVLRGPEHVFELANERYYELVGRRDLIGRPGREALPELVPQGVWDLVDQVYASGEQYVAQDFPARVERLGTGRPADGYFSFVLQPLRSMNGQTEGILIHAVEVTDQVFVRRALDEARQAAEAANRAKDQFLAMLGHELRNPLAPILTALQLMAMRGEIGAEKERAIIERQVRHVVRLVDDLLDVSRIARGRIELKRAPIELAAVVGKAVEMSSPVIEQKQHVLELDVRSGLIVDADSTRLEQVVFNLLNNAAKYTEPRGRIVVTAAANEGMVELRIRDSGIGIDAAMLPHVFDLFVQDHQALDRSQGGLGLGLAIVRNLVELHGGRVSASSDGPGRGSEFVVALPAATARQAARDGDVAEEPASDARPRMRVLVVDDNPDASHMLAEALAFEGFESRTAADGPAALRAVDEFSPHVALLDLGLPVMDGYELAAQLRQRPDAPQLIAVTGYGAAADHERSTAAGFADHLVKPVDVDELVQSLRRLGTSSKNP